jgi:hypothetical protein
MIEATSCVQVVAQSGYRIYKEWLKPGKKRMFEPIIGVPSAKVRCKRYKPLLEPSLFRRFAALDGSENSILGFANKYGLLFEGIPVQIPNSTTELAQDENQVIFLVPADEHDRYNLVYGERISAWREEIDRMRRAVELWELIRHKDTTALREQIKWNSENNPEGILYEEGSMVLPNGLEVPAYVETITSKWYRRELFKDLVSKPGCPVIKPARMLLQRWINEKLKSTVGLRLLWDSSVRNLVMCVQPYCLLGAMWYQLALEMINPGQKIKLCEACGNLFEYDRSTRRFCSDACRKRAARKLRRQE